MKRKAPKRARARHIPGSERLAVKLAASDLSRSDLCARLGIDESMLSRLLNGHRSPSLATALLLEKELGIPAVSWL